MSHFSVIRLMRSVDVDRNSRVCCWKVTAVTDSCNPADICASQALNYAIMQIDLNRNVMQTRQTHKKPPLSAERRHHTALCNTNRGNKKFVQDKL